MPCYVSEEKQCHTRTEQRAANGTTCGDRMVSILTVIKLVVTPVIVKPKKWSVLL